MGTLIRLLLPMRLLRPLLKPVTRLIVGALAIPLFRLFLRRVVRLQEIDKELEKDLEQWFRGSLLLLVATANMEQLLFEWVPLDLREQHAWVAVAFRLLLAIGVIEAMPDQQLFAIIHPGPKPLVPQRGKSWFGLKDQIRPYLKGTLCQHLSRSSPVFAIMAAIFGGDPSIPGQFDHWVVGWCCYFIAIVQYLIIGLVTSRDMAVDALAEFDKQVALRRQDLLADQEDLEKRVAEADRQTAPAVPCRQTAPAEPIAEPNAQSAKPAIRKRSPAAIATVARQRVD